MASSNPTPEKKKTGGKLQKTQKRKKPLKPVRQNKLFRGKTPQQKKELQAQKQKKRETELAKLEESYSAERYVSAEEALGPTVYNEGYLKKAKGFRYARYGVLMLLVIFLFAMLSFFKEEITIENFRYLMRNVDFELRTELGEAGEISYDSNPLNTFAVYKNSLAQLSDRQIAIYDESGRSSYTGTLNYASPALVTSPKYLLAYDRQGGDYSLYTGFSKVHSASTGYPIADADLSDKGVFVIASRSKEYFGTVEVYSASFQLMNKIRKNKYIASADLSDDGKMLLIASYYVGDAGICTEIMSLAVDSDQPDLLFTLEGILPWQASWTGDGRFVLVCEEGVKFYDREGKVRREYGFSADSVIEYKVSESDGRVAVLEQTADGIHGARLTLLSADGKLITRNTIPERPTGMIFGQQEMILVAGHTVFRLQEDGKLFRFDSDSAIRSAAAGKDILYLCTATRVISPKWKAVKE